MVSAIKKHLKTQSLSRCCRWWPETLSTCHWNYIPNFTWLCSLSWETWGSWGTPCTGGELRVPWAKVRKARGCSLSVTQIFLPLTNFLPGWYQEQRRGGKMFCLWPEMKGAALKWWYADKVWVHLQANHQEPVRGQCDKILMVFLLSQAVFKLARTFS